MPQRCLSDILLQEIKCYSFCGVFFFLLPSNLQCVYMALFFSIRESKSADLLIMGLHAQKYSVGSQASQAPFQIGLAPKFLRFGVKIIQGPHSFFKLLPVNLNKGSHLETDIRAGTKI